MINTNLPQTTPVLDSLYFCYLEQHPLDKEAIGQQFSELADVLGKLTLKDHDLVWNLTCSLCAEHEKQGFREGIRTGMCLIKELYTTREP